MASRTQLRLTQITGSVDDTKAAAATIDETSVQGVLDHLAASIQRIHGGSVFQNQTAGAFSQTIDVTGAITSSAGANIGGDLEVGTDILIGDDAFFNSDAAVINFGADDDVSLTHVADTGLLLNSSRQLQFGDADTYVAQASDGVLQLRSDTTIKTVIGASDTLTINSAGATFGQNVTITGNLDVNGTTTTIDTANLTVEDSIIGLGVSGSDNSFSNVGDRGIVFAKGAAASSLLPAFYYSGDDDIFQLGKTATDASSGSFADPTLGNHSTLRLGAAEFASANDNIGVKQNGTLEISGSNGINIRGDGANIQIQTIGSGRDIVFKNDANTLLTLDDAYGHSLTGELRISGQNGSTPGALVLKDSDDSNQVTLKAPGTVTANYELLLPQAIGTGTQVLRLNSGATALEFADVSASGNTSKQVLIIDATISAGSVLNTNTGTANVTYAGDAINDLSVEGTQGKVLDVFVNGQLLVSGSSAQRTDGSRDYEVASTNELKFAFDLEADDIVQAVKRG